MNIGEIRQKYKEFVYEDFEYFVDGDDLVFQYIYSVGLDIKFEHKVVVRGIEEGIGDDDFLKVFAFNLGMFESINYYKATCSPIFKIKCGYLDEDQIIFFKTYFIKGLGELFYQNKIDFTPDDFLRFDIEDGAPKFEVDDTWEVEDKIIVPVGGGKDSGTVLGVFNREGIEYTALLVTPHSQFESTLNLISEIGEDKPIIIDRILDMEKLKEMNVSGFINGHIPITGIISMISTLACRLFGYKYIVMATASTANEATLKYLGYEINHQWSKSYEFEKMFKTYIETYVASSIDYFSFIRPLLDLQIVKIFSKFDELLPLFRSCNKGNGTWCGKCPKCFFMYLAMYPFENPITLNDMYGGDLLNDESHVENFRHLLGLAEGKPFDCIGTVEENQVATYLSYKKVLEAGGQMPLMLKIFEDELLGQFKDWDSKVDGVMRYYNEDNFVPDQFLDILRKYLEKG